MLALRVVVVFLVIGLPSVASAAGSLYPITLKKDLFQGFRWSSDDGYSYQRVGHGGDSLRAYMSGNEQAVEKMIDYQTRKRVGRITGYTCAVGAAYVLWRAMGDSYVEPRDNPLLLATLGVGIVSMVLHWTAEKRLKDAVDIFNRDSGWPRLSLELDGKSPDGKLAMGIGIGMAF